MTKEKHKGGQQPLHNRWLIPAAVPQAFSAIGDAQ
jgi:hypothetical protein